ncbi:MAG: hypothetical protein H6999_03530 [Hahellaceae bacterium]|nr:hypothetical protein [Hahellaceae bacterium]MCP5168809.1 hypothetical protein [Hahellaceae bacterium]
MIYLYTYFLVGAILVVTVHMHHKFTEDENEQSLEKIQNSLRPANNSLWLWLRGRIFELLMTTFILIPLWPFLALLKIWQIIGPKSLAHYEADPVFSVKQGDLCSQLSIEEIEQIEIVEDPFHAAPRIPFGHLNSSWKKFLEQLLPTDTLWSFEVEWDDVFVPKLMRGYVIVREEQPGPFVVTYRRMIDKMCQ